MYLLKRTTKAGGYVAMEGYCGKSSYVRNLRYARKFQTIEEAELHRCIENEIILPYKEVFYA